MGPVWHCDHLSGGEGGGAGTLWWWGGGGKERELLFFSLICNIFCSLFIIPPGVIGRLCFIVVPPFAYILYCFSVFTIKNEIG